MTPAQRAIHDLQVETAAIEPKGAIQEARKQAQEHVLRVALQRVIAAESPKLFDSGVITRLFATLKGK